MPIGDIRFTVLQIVNEVQRKLGLSETATLGANKLSKQMVDFVNDICDDLSDFGNWQESLVSANVTAVSGQSDYSVNTSANIKNIGDIYFTLRTGPLRNITINDMRLLTRTSAVGGMPTQYTVFGTDANGNPNIRVRPTPASNEAGGLFSIVYYVRAPVYTTADNNTVVPFPGNLVVDGVLAKAILNESEGAPTDRYTLVWQAYMNARKEALNRFNGDTGWEVAFVPNRGSRRRR